MTPYFNSLRDLVMMGGHGVYVWTCWGLVLLAVVVGIWQSRRKRQQAIGQIITRQSQKKQQSPTTNR